MDTTAEIKKAYAREWRKHNPERLTEYARRQKEKNQKVRRAKTVGLVARNRVDARTPTILEVQSLLAAVKAGATYAEAGRRHNRTSGTVCNWLAPYRAEIAAAHSALPCPVHPTRVGVGRLLGRGRTCPDCIAERHRAIDDRFNASRRMPPEEKAQREAERERRETARQIAADERRAARELKSRFPRLPTPEEKRAERARYKKRNPDKVRALRSAAKARRRARELGSLGVCTAEEARRIAALYALARRKTQETGQQWDVHHIIPLSKNGRHHPDNMEVIPAAINNAIGDNPMTGLDYVTS